MTQPIKVIDSHTGGEPTRIIYVGGPDLGSGPLQERVVRFRENHDAIRRATVMEPRGSDVLVGGLLVEPNDPKFAAGIIFFNNHDYLGMCGHGTIGLMATLKHLGRIDDGEHWIETPVGPVKAIVSGHETTLFNVPSFRLKENVTVDVPKHGSFTGDIAWGGNWFFLVKDYEGPLTLSEVGGANGLMAVSVAIRDALWNSGITGSNGAWIDHVELFGEPLDPQNDSRNFVLCPGGAFDRSPCGTGTSAKLACLAASNRLKPGQIWRQESIIGSVFSGSYQWLPNSESSEEFESSDEPAIVPSICGTAFVNSEATLILNSDDPFCMGIES